MSMSFYHPNRGAPTTTVTIGDKEQNPSTRPTRGLQSAFETDAGEVFVYQWGPAIAVFPLRLWPLAKADADALEAFFITTVNYRVERFDFDDSLGRQYTCQLAQGVVSPIRRGIYYELSVSLRVVA